MSPLRRWTVAAFAMLLVLLPAWLIGRGRGWGDDPVSRELLQPHTPTQHPPPAFPFSIAAAYKNERGVMEFLLHAPLEAQVRMDIALHDAAIIAGAFDADGLRFLRENSGLKRRVLRLLSTPDNDHAEAASVIAGLRQCEDIHRIYLARPPSVRTGSHEWHKAWMSAYNEWSERIGSNAR